MGHGITKNINMKLIVFSIIIFIFFSSVSFAAKEKSKEDELLTLTKVPSTLVYPSFWHTPFGVHRGTPFWLKVFLGNKTYFSKPQDVAATKLKIDYGKINKGKDDWQLTAYGINSGRSEIIYNQSMHSLNVYGSEGRGEGQFYRPYGIACNEYGDVYVADTGNHRIVRLYDSGKELRFIRNIGNKGSEKGEFKKPKYIALDSRGQIYVSDTGNNRIQIFSKSGGIKKIIGQNKGILNPQGIVVCDKNELYNGYKHNYIYIIDGNNDRIQKFDFKGVLVRSVRLAEVLGKAVFLTTLEQDYYGNIYVVDKMNSVIHKFSPDLNYITDFGGYGKDDYHFEKPTGIAIYKHYGQLIVSDRESAQYFWIGSDAKYLKVRNTGDDITDALSFNFLLTEKSYVTIEIKIADDKKVEICKKLALDMGRNSISWEVPQQYLLYFIKGERYKAVLKVSATYSSYPHIEKEVTRRFVF